MGKTGSLKFYKSLLDYARGLIATSYVPNHLIIPKNASLSGWVPPGWSESAFTSARKYFAGTTLADSVGTKGQGAIRKEKLIKSKTQYIARILGSRWPGQPALIHFQGTISKGGKTRKGES